MVKATLSGDRYSRPRELHGSIEKSGDTDPVILWRESGRIHSSAALFRENSPW
jgi:hypothetical protein